MNSKSVIHFTEEQRFTQWWMWLFIAIPFIIGVFGCYKQLILAENFGNKPMSNLGLVFTTLFGVAFMLFFYINKLTTKITDKGVYVQFFPYTKRFHSWEEISQAEVIKYGFVGGWGVRLWTQYGTVYNVKGGRGLYVQLKGKENFLIGTQNPEALHKVVLQLSQVTTQ